MKRTLSGSHIPVPDHHNQHWTLSFFSIEWSWKHMSTPCTLSKCSPHCLGPNSAFYWQKWTGPNVEGNCTCGTTIAAKTICQKYAVLVSTWNFLQVAGLTSRNFQNLLFMYFMHHKSRELTSVSAAALRLDIVQPRRLRMRWCTPGWLLEHG